MLVGDIDLSGAGFTKTLGKLTGEFDGFVGKLGKFGSLAAGLSNPLAGLGAVSGFMGGLEKVMRMGDSLQELSLATGQSVHDLVVLRQALNLSGVGADQAQKFIFKLQSAVGGLNEQGNSTAASLAKLGLTSQQLSKMSAIEQIDALHKGLMGVQDQGSKAAIVMDLFGKKMGPKAMRVLADPEVFDKAKSQAEPLAKIMGENAEQFHKLGEAMKGLSLHSDEFFAGALSEVAKDGTEFFDKLGNVDFTGIGEMVGSLASIFLKLAKVLADLAPLLNSVSKYLDSIFGHHDDKVTAAISASVKKPHASHDPTAVSALRRIGLGGRVGVSGGGAHSDPILEENRNQTRVLQQIANNTNPGIRADIPGVAKVAGAVTGLGPLAEGAAAIGEAIGKAILAKMNMRPHNPPTV